MNVNGRHFRGIWPKETDQKIIQVIDQRWLPHKFVIEDLKTVNDFLAAIKDMHIRGAPLVGATAAFGMYLAALEAPKDRSFDEFVSRTGEMLKATRPTAVNLAWAVEKQLQAMKKAETAEEKL